MASSVYNSFQALYGLNIAKDYSELSRPQGTAWDIGAFEFYSGGGGDTTPPVAPQGLVIQ